MNRPPNVIRFFAGLWLVLQSSPLCYRKENTSRNEPKIFARFVGAIKGMSLDRKPIPTIPIGYDPRYFMVVEIIDVMQGELPAPIGGSMAFLIHSPALFFRSNIGRVPGFSTQYLEGPFEFTVIVTNVSRGQEMFDLKIKELK